MSPSGDVLQLSLPLRGALLLPGERFDAEGSSGWHRAHVHAQGEAPPAVPFKVKHRLISRTGPHE